MSLRFKNDAEMSSTHTVDLFCRDLGGEGKPPLVVLHGVLGSSRNWQTAGGELTGAAHVLALDLRNHGRSPHADEMNYDAMVADVLAWMDARGLRRVALMGHSMGGKVAMAFACRNPERVERLIVVDIAPKDYHSPAQRNEFAAMNSLDLRAISSRGDAERHFETCVDSWAMRKFLATNLERDGETGGWRWGINLPVITTALPVLEANPLRDEERFEGKALFVTGGKSNYVDASEGSADRAAIMRHFPGARIETIAASGHNPHMETRAEFARIVLADLMR